MEYIIRIETKKTGYRSYTRTYRLYDKSNNLIAESGNFEKDILPIITR